MLGLNALIWVSVKPVLKIVLTACMGIFLSKTGILPTSGTKMLSRIVVNVFLPSLQFSRVVESIDNSDLKTLGILLIASIGYVALGCLSGVLLRTVVPCPPRFRYGIIAAATFGNWGDLSLAIIMSIGTGPPFSASDESKGIAYVSVFVFTFFLFMFPLGGCRLIAADFKDRPEDTESLQPNPLDTEHKQNPEPDHIETASTIYHPTPNQSEVQIFESKSADIQYNDDKAAAINLDPSMAQAEKIESHHSQAEYLENTPSPSSTEPTSYPISKASAAYRNTCNAFSIIRRTITSCLNSIIPRPIQRFSLAIARSLFTPSSTALFAGLLVALVNPLKALFVPVPGYEYLYAVDGQPCLGFIYDWTSFLAGASVPSGILLLGCGLATLQIRHIKPLSCLCLAVAKLIVMPVIGIGVVMALVNAGILDRSDKMLLFVLMFQGCTPTATTNVYLTQLYSPTGKETQDIAAYLAVQYILGMITMTVTMCVSLHLIY